MSKFDLLWTNPSPNSSFAEQDISNIDLEPYDLVAVKYRSEQSNKFQISLQIFFWDDPAADSLRAGYATSGNLFAARRMTYNNTTKVIHFGGAAYNNTSNSNSYLVPQKIFGIKL